MHVITSPECARIAQDLQIRKVQVESVVQLLDEGNSVPFINRYRKQRTGGLNEDMIRQVQARVNSLRQLHDRKQTILKSIEHHGKLTDELRQAILGADTLRRLDDLYLPYKPKKRGPAATARERGLEAPALAVWHSDPVAGNLDELLPALVNPERELKTADDVRTGIGLILADWIAENADVRAPLRAALWELGKVAAAKSDKVPEGHGLEYKDYFQFNESARQIPPHRILALNRGDKEGALKVQLDYPKERIQEIALHAVSELLLKKAGETPPLPVASASASNPIVAPAAEIAAPTAEVVASPPVAEAEQSAADATVSASPPAEHVPVSEPIKADQESAPLVAAMEPKAPVTLTGEPLAPSSAFRSPHVAFLKAVLDDALARLVLPNLEREIRRELTDEAEGHAVAIFARNLRSLLLQPPLRGKRVLAVDPGFRAGCKVAALDEQGDLIDHCAIHPFTPPPRKQREKPQPVVAATPAPAAPETGATSENPAPTPPSEAAAQAQAVEPTVDAASVPVPVEVAPAAPVEAAATPPTESTPAPAVVETPAAPPPPPVDKKAEAKASIKDAVTKHQLQIVAIGNGNGCRETEEIIAELIASDLPDLSYVVVNEAGASVYSISQVGREEFPSFDPTLRSAISIGRRLQDPLSELVKVDPQSIGVGLYQHDMSRKELRESLDGVVESCVNQVGVDVNTASVPLLRHISGLNQMVARELVDWRKQHGAFTSREQLLQLTGLGPQRWMQSVGFLRIGDAANPLDRTWIHPESYGLTEKLLGHFGHTTSVVTDAASREELRLKLRETDFDELARSFDTIPPVLYDIFDELLKPGYDPREELPPPIFKKGILRLEDLQPGMELKGTVLNVVDFGAFVDIGLKDSGLVHISQLANRYIKSPYEVVAVNDVVGVWVLTVDMERRRVSLTMIAPGTERAPQERRPRREDGGRPRGRRPGGPPRDQHGQPGPHDQQVAPAGEGTPYQGDAPRDERGPRPPRGRHHGRGHGRPPQHGAPAAESQMERGHGHGAPPPRPQLPPRKPRREPPKPKLSQAAIEGKVPLRTFSELSALFAAKKEKEASPPPSAPSVAPETSAPATAPAPAADLVVATSDVPAVAVSPSVETPAVVEAPQAAQTENP